MLGLSATIFLAAGFALVAGTAPCFTAGAFGTVGGLGWSSGDSLWAIAAGGSTELLANSQSESTELVESTRLPPGYCAIRRRAAKAA